MEGLFQPMHLLVIFFIALLIFGPKKLPELGKGIGEGFRSLKEGIRTSPSRQPTPRPQPPPRLARIRKQRANRYALESLRRHFFVSATARPQADTGAFFPSNSFDARNSI